MQEMSVEAMKPPVVPVLMLPTPVRAMQRRLSDRHPAPIHQLAVIMPRSFRETRLVERCMELPDITDQATVMIALASQEVILPMARLEVILPMAKLEVILPMDSLVRATRSVLNRPAGIHPGLNRVTRVVLRRLAMFLHLPKLHLRIHPTTLLSRVIRPVDTM